MVLRLGDLPASSAAGERSRARPTLGRGLTARSRVRRSVLLRQHEVSSLNFARLGRAQWTRRSRFAISDEMSMKVATGRSHPSVASQPMVRLRSLRENASGRDPRWVAVSPLRSRMEVRRLCLPRQHETSIPELPPAWHWARARWSKPFVIPADEHEGNDRALASQRCVSADGQASIAAGER
jgi:hypothetical protein